ncbi:Nn.00g104630.m01.CDS01 [Neocucurbitaria sp. VM-36]
MASSATDRDALNREEAESKNKNSSEEHGETKGYQQNASLTEDGKDADKKEKKSSKIKKIWDKLALDVPTLLMMGKAALPPTIALAMEQADDVAQTFTTLGYLVAIISILGFCIMPRAKFIQTMVMNIIGTCVGAAVAMLMVWSAVKAREHTTVPGAPAERYNSSQSVVLGVWLFFQIYVVNALKAKFPQLAFPSILYAIQVNIAATNGFLFRTVPQCEMFIKRLLEAFLTGFALATGVSLFIIPVTCRKVVSKEITGYITLLRGALGAHKNYIHSLESTDMFGQTYVPEEEDKTKNKKDKDKKPKVKPEIAAIKKMIGALEVLHGKLAADLPFAKREVAYGKLSPDDFQTMFKQLRLIFLPVLGLGSVMDLFERGAEINHWDGEVTEYDEEVRKRTISEWNELFKFLREPLDNIFQALDDGLAHILIRLQFVKPPKKKKGQSQEDAEAKGDQIKPGDKGFAEHFEKQAAIFFSTKEPTLRHWVESKGIKLSKDYFSCSDTIDEETLKLLPSITTRKRDQRQLYTVLYVMFLLNAISRATLDFVKFADEHDQATAKSKLIWPGARRFKKWIKSIFHSQDSNQDDETTIAGFDRNNTTVYMGEAYKSKKDPEHLPPSNAWEKFGNLVRYIAHFLRSDESAFGFRAACATMSIAIIAFLRPTQTFFVEQRLVWALIMVAISMTPTAGQSIFQFVLRIAGTAIAMIVAWLIWYIPGQHTAGIIVFLWVFVALGFYVPLKRLDLVIAGIISVVTATMIVGYELQVRKIGVQAAVATTGQPAYPIYELGPYRLATVAGGLAVAFFWTIFPYPITEHSALRQKLGGALYLSANFYSIMHEQVMARIRGDAGDEENDKESPGYALIKARNKVFAKQMLTLQGLKLHSSFVRWEFPLGGKFPVEQYEKIIELVSNIVNYTSLLGYASQPFTQPSFNVSTLPDTSSPLSPTTEKMFPKQASAQWIHDFRRVLSEAKVTSHEITSLLAMLSSSITNGQPLPPYLHAPPGYQLGERMDAVDHDILSLRHVAEPGYAAFAVMAISTRCINMDIEKLLVAVKKLVGELDFSFHVVSTQASSPTSSSETLIKKSSRRSRKQD